MSEVKTVCVAGHPLVGSNVYLTPDGRRQCRACRDRRADTYRAANHDHTRAARSRRSVERTRQAKINAKDVPCADCGQRYPHYVMDFDHRPGEVKSFQFGSLTHIGAERFAAEIAKCDVVCANCHRERTHARGFDF